MNESLSAFCLYNGDCLEIMKQIPDGSVDMVVTDPPYKMNHSTGGRTSIGFEDRWRGNIKAGNTEMGFNTKISFSQWLPDVYRVLKPKGHCYVFCNDKNLLQLLIDSKNVGLKESNVLVWVKNNACPNRYYMKNCEFIAFMYKGNAKPIKNMGDKAAVACNNIIGKKKKHPTEKPVDLLERFIVNSSCEGDIILDPFMGAGSSGVACVNTRRRFIGIELETKYFKIASERIENAANEPEQLSLF